VRRKRLTTLHEDLEASVNLTPLIDVVFVVLIIFIIIAPMLEVDRVELSSGAKTPNKQAAASENNLLTIHVHQDNTIWFQGKCVTQEQLAQLLQRAYRSGNTRSPQLFQDKRACFGTYQQVKNAVETAGFGELDVILKPG
jgi:biopolymer transport protein ExbD